MIDDDTIDRAAAVRPKVSRKQRSYSKSSRDYRKISDIKSFPPKISAAKEYKFIV